MPDIFRSHLNGVHRSGVWFLVEHLKAFYTDWPPSIPCTNINQHIVVKGDINDRSRREHSKVLGFHSLVS